MKREEKAELLSMKPKKMVELLSMKPEEKAELRAKAALKVLRELLDAAKAQTDPIRWRGEGGPEFEDFVHALEIRRAASLAKAMGKSQGNGCRQTSGGKPVGPEYPASCRSDGRKPGARRAWQGSRAQAGIRGAATRASGGDHASDQVLASRLCSHLGR